MSIQRGRELFSKEQRKLFMKYPEDEWTIGSYYTFSKYDLEIIMKHRKEENKLGFAIQLAALRYPGWSYSSNKTIPIEIIQYIANQVCTVPKALKLYSLRNNTSRDHIKELKKEYGYSSFSTNDSKFLLKYLVNLAFENNDSLFLMNQSLEYLRKKKIILPAITTLENLVWEAKNKSEKFIINTIVSSLNPTQRNKLNDIVFLQSEKLKGKTILVWLKEPIGSPSPDNFLKVIEKLEYIRSLNLENTQLVKVHKNKINQIYSLAQRYEPYAFREFNIDKRHMLLSVFLLNLSKDLTDKAFEIHNKLIINLMAKGRKAQEGTTIYRFTSDQFSSYYSKIINTNSRDATHVLDGLLNNDTDLNIEEHYTDTAGYTDQVFALTYLLGFRFAPRIRDLSDVKLFTLNRCDKFSNLDGILKGKINEKIIKDNYDEVLRLASSIKEGTVTSSLIISKLASYSRQNSLATALKEMGKIEKTIFILDYISSEELRRKIQKGLNKGEAMNGLARAIFFGKQGELRERTMQNQLQKASALNLIINAINIWNTLYLEKAISYKESIGEYIDYNLISHISPLGWEHINMLGEYTFNLNELESTELYRPLNI